MNAKMPWGFSFGPTPGKAMEPNVPCAIGEALGEQLARLAAPCIEEQRRAFPKGLPQCNECAFTKGTLPNRCAATVADALKSVVEGVPFYCHKGVADDADPVRLCTGWAACSTTLPVATQRRGFLEKVALAQSARSASPLPTEIEGRA